jgi:hypothetical protein
MAYIDIVGGTPSTIDHSVATEVYVRAEWADSWIYTPYIIPIQVRESANPQVDTAAFVYDFGTILRPEIGDYAIYQNVDLRGYYIRVDVVDQFGRANAWVGIIDVDTTQPFGNVTTPTGSQYLTAFGLEHLLNRRPISGAYVRISGDAGSPTVDLVDRAIPINRTRRAGSDFDPNASSVDDPATGYPYFAIGEVDSIAWTNKRVIEYVLGQWMGTTGIIWTLTGETDILSQISNVYDIEGQTPLAVVNTMIERRRGLSWKVLIDENDNVEINVFSLLSEPVAGWEVLLPANPNQVDLIFAGSRTREPQYRFSNLALYDEIQVIGGPVLSTFSLSYTDGTLVQGWTAAEETDYKNPAALSSPSTEELDAERATERFNRVYQDHGIVTDWNWQAGDGQGANFTNVAPLLNLDGTLDYTQQSPQFDFGKSFTREIPVDEAGTTSGRLTLSGPRVWVEVQNEDEDLISANITNLGPLGYASASISLLERQLGLRLEAPLNHIMAKNSFDPETTDTAVEPQYDYSSMIMTVTAELDQRLSVFVQTSNDIAGEIGRTKRIDVPDAILWIMAPQCAVETEAGAMVRADTKYPSLITDNGIYRDDSAGLRAIAAVAQAWYALPRATLEYSVSRISLENPIGTLIKSTVGPEGSTNVGTCVTSRIWNFDPENQSTEIATQFEELDFVGG